MQGPVAHLEFGKGGGGTTEGETPSLRRLRAANKFLRFSHKNIHFNTFFYQESLAVSAVTMDNAKIFSHLMSKSRSLAKIREKRL